MVRIRALVRRAKGVTNTIQVSDLKINIEQRNAIRDKRKLKLSPTGWVLLEILAKNSPNVVYKEQLERAIWGDAPPENDNLRAHIFKLRRQLQRADEPPLLHTVSGTGFALRGDDL